MPDIPQHGKREPSNSPGTHPQPKTKKHRGADDGSGAPSVRFKLRHGPPENQRRSVHNDMAPSSPSPASGVPPQMLQWPQSSGDTQTLAPLDGNPDLEADVSVMHSAESDGANSDGIISQTDDGAALVNDNPGYQEDTDASDDDSSVDDSSDDDDDDTSYAPGSSEVSTPASKSRRRKSTGKKASHDSVLSATSKDKKKLANSCVKMLKLVKGVRKSFEARYSDFEKFFDSTVSQLEAFKDIVAPETKDKTVEVSFSRANSELLERFGIIESEIQIIPEEEFDTSVDEAIELIRSSPDGIDNPVLQLDDFLQDNGTQLNDNIIHNVNSTNGHSEMNTRSLVDEQWNLTRRLDFEPKSTQLEATASTSDAQGSDPAHYRPVFFPELRITPSDGASKSMGAVEITYIPGKDHGSFKKGTPVLTRVRGSVDMGYAIRRFKDNEIVPGINALGIPFNRPEILETNLLGKMVIVELKNEFEVLENHIAQAITEAIAFCTVTGSKFCVWVASNGIQWIFGAVMARKNSNKAVDDIKTSDAHLAGFTCIRTAVINGYGVDQSKKVLNYLTLAAVITTVEDLHVLFPSLADN